MIWSQDIPVVEQITESDFNQLYFIPQKPVIIKGLIKEQKAGKDWNFTYFKETMGDVQVDVFDNAIKNEGSAYTSANLKMRFADFLNEIETNEKTTLRMFLFNLFKHKPELKKEFPCPFIFRGILDNLGFTFFAGKDTTVRLHFDIDMSNVLHTQVWGKKRVVLISPEYNNLLYKLPLNSYALIDIDKPDYTHFPGLKYVRVSECFLEPGDSLFMPSGYWHLMNYQTAGMSVAYRKLSGSPKTVFKGMLNLFLYLPFDKLMNKLFDSSWLNFKKNLANKRAETSMKSWFINHHSYIIWTFVLISF